MGIAVAFDSDTRRVEPQNHTITIGPEIVRNGSYYLTALDSGQVLLTPVDSIPEEERAVWENPRIRESLGRGLAEVSNGELFEVPDLFDDLDDE